MTFKPHVLIIMQADHNSQPYWEVYVILRRHVTTFQVAKPLR